MKSGRNTCDVLEAKILLGENLIVSIAREFIENNGEEAENQKEMSEEKRKQDCETKAFRRLAKKLKEAFPRSNYTSLVSKSYPHRYASKVQSPLRRL